MGVQVGELPWDPTIAASFSTSLGGRNLGDTFRDERGRTYMLVALSNALTNDTIAANEVLYVAATSVTYPTGQSGSFTVTNTRANALGGDNAYAAYAGQALGTVAEAASSAAADNRFILIGVQGRFTVKTNGDNNGVAGDYLIHTGNGTADIVLQNDTSTQTAAVLANKIGRALGTEASSAVDAFIHSRFWGI